MKSFTPHIGLQVILGFVLSQYATSDCLLPNLKFPDGTYILPETYINDANRTMVEDMSVVQFVCNIGYELHGQQFLLCDDNYWTSEFPFCIDPKCPTPPTVENATHEVYIGVSDDPVVGSLAVYTCKDGNMLADETESTLECILRTSSRTVTWVGKMPVCKERTACPDPGVSVKGWRSRDCCEDGSVRCEGSGDVCSAGDTLHYTCDEGYELVGNRELRCLPDGVWSSARPLCRPLEGSCEFPPPNPFGVLTGDKRHDYFVVGDEAHLLCKLGYRLKGEEFVVCGQGGVWKREFGVCEEIFCYRPPPLEHGRIPELEKTNQTIFPYDSDISYVCDNGYRLYPTESWRSCGKRGWSGRTPRCKAIRCPDPGIPENGFRIGSNFTMGSKVSFDCFSGYELLGSIEMFCLPNGQWSGEVARCNSPSNYCPDPGTPINGYKNMSQYQMRDKVGFRCNGADRLVGSRVRECLDDTTWSGTRTRCVGKYDFDSKEQVRDLVNLKIAEIREEQQRFLDAWKEQPRWTGGTLDSNFRRIILYFAFDVSRSITKLIFDKNIAFAKAFVSKVGISLNGSRAGALTFSSKVYAQFLPLSFDSTEAVLDALDKIQYTGRDIDSSSALRTIRMQYIPLAKEWLGDAERKSVIIILTDGKAIMAGNPQTEADLLKKAGVEIYCIGITGGTNKDVLYDIASTSQYGLETRPNVFMLQDYNALAWLVQEMTNGSIERTSCPDPGVSANGWKSRDCCEDGSVHCVESGHICRVGDIIRYTCHDGYGLTGNKELHCLPGGIWSSVRPMCRLEIFCERPSPPEHGSIPELEKTNQTIFPEDFEISYVCDKDYRIYSGNRFRSCGNRGWSGRTPRCYDFSQCGIGDETFGSSRGRIFARKDNSHRWPWMAVLNMTRGNDVNGPRTLKCGGSIIDRYLILTSAQCLYNNQRQRNAPEIQVELGLTVLSNKTYHQTRSVRKFHIHEQYRPGGDSYDYDIALLELDSPIDYNAYVRPICLPPKVLPRNSEFYKPQSIAWAIGFGHTGVVRPGSTNMYFKISKTLKEIALPIQPRHLCLNSLRDNRGEHLFTDNMFCAGTGEEGKIGICRGDSGGPVMQRHLNEDGYVSWVQVGVLSWGVGCSLKDEFDFCTHLQRLMPWIENKIETSKTSIGV